MLRGSTVYCDYSNNLENMLRDRLVCGIQHEGIEKQLLSEGDAWPLKKALNIALAIESTFEYATVINSTKTEPFDCKLEPVKNVRDKKTIIRKAVIDV